ncbi:MAG: hypothetical protein ABI840_09250, partial [bacterium]
MKIVIGRKLLFLCDLFLNRLKAGIFRIILISFLLSSVHTNGQDSVRVANDDVTILYRNEAAGGLHLHSNGFGITFKRGWHMTGYKKQ